MDPLIILGRVLHVGLGAFWVGTALFFAAFLMPAMRDAGPDAAKVAEGLMKRRFMQVIPAASMLTLLSGIYLYWRLSAGFSAAYMTTPAGATYLIGGSAAILAFAIAASIVRSAMLRAAELTQAGMAAAPPERAAAMGQAQALRARAEAAQQWVAWLLVVAILAMAVARYL
jgi:uncharacterized membrane protein